MWYRFHISVEESLLHVQHVRNLECFYAGQCGMIVHGERQKPAGSTITLLSAMCPLPDDLLKQLQVISLTDALPQKPQYDSGDASVNVSSRSSKETHPQ